MKKTLLLLITLLIVACSSKKDSIINKVDDVLGQPSKIEGNVYTYSNVSEKNVYKDYKDLKDMIDKQLNCLPTEIHELETSATGEIYSQYKWDTPNISISMWIAPDETKRFIQFTIKEK